MIKKSKSPHEQKDLFQWVVPNLRLNADFPKVELNFGRELKEQLRATMEQVVEPFRKSLQRMQSELTRDFHELPAKWRKAFLALANQGWFMDIDSSPGDALRLADMIDDEGRASIDDILVSYFRDKLNAIEDSLKASFPNRSHIIYDAFKAHRQGMYTCSITVLLTQIDGVCKELTTGSFFEGADKDKIRLFLKTNNHFGWLREFLVVLEEPTAIRYTRSERGKDFDQLNRHLVLHGESTDFPTEVNSYKAISLLRYLESFVLKLGKVETSK